MNVFACCAVDDAEGGAAISVADAIKKRGGWKNFVKQVLQHERKERKSKEEALKIWAENVNNNNRAVHTSEQTAVTPPEKRLAINFGTVKVSSLGVSCGGFAALDGDDEHEVTWDCTRWGSDVNDMPRELTWKEKMVINLDKGEGAIYQVS